MSWSERYRHETGSVVGTESNTDGMNADRDRGGANAVGVDSLRPEDRYHR